MSSEVSSDFAALITCMESIEIFLECDHLGGANNFLSWKNHIENILDKQTLSKTVERRTIWYSLTPGPREWLDFHIEDYRKKTNNTEPTRYELLNALEDQFYNTSWKNNTIQNLHRSQEDMNGLEPYIFGFHSNSELLNVITKEHLIVHLFVRGLPPYMRADILVKAPGDLQKAIRIAYQMHRGGHNQSKTQKKAKKSKNVVRVAKPKLCDIKCACCGKLGHHVSNCKDIPLAY